MYLRLARIALVILVARDTLKAHTASGRMTFLTRGDPWQEHIARLRTLGCRQIRAVTQLTGIFVGSCSLESGRTYMRLVVELPVHEPAGRDLWPDHGRK